MNEYLQQLLLCATQSLFTCDTQQGGTAQANGSSPTSIQVWGPIQSNHLGHKNYEIFVYNLNNNIF